MDSAGCSGVSDFQIRTRKYSLTRNARPKLRASASGRMDGMKEDALSKFIFELHDEHFDCERRECCSSMPQDNGLVKLPQLDRGANEVQVAKNFGKTDGD
jgi:hypothetical protein